MKFKIRMTSGREITGENLIYNDLEDWIKGNFDAQASITWFKPFKDNELILNFNLIESIECEYE